MLFRSYFIFSLVLFTQPCSESFIFSDLVSSSEGASLDSAALLCISKKKMEVSSIVCKCTSHHYHIHIVHVTYMQFSFSSVQFSCSVVSDSLRPSELQQPGLPVHHHLPEFTQTHFHRVGDAIQPSHPLLSPFPPAPNTSQHQTLFH